MHTVLTYDFLSLTGIPLAWRDYISNNLNPVSCPTWIHANSWPLPSPSLVHENQRVFNDLIYKGLGFPAVVWYGSSPISTPSPACKLDRRIAGRLRKRDNLLIGKGGGEEPNHSTARKHGPLEIIQYSLAQTLGYCANCGAMIRLRLIGNREARRAGSRGQGTVPKNLQLNKEANSKSRLSLLCPKRQVMTLSYFR